MAKYRQLHLTFWHDPFIEELTPMEKYFYIYLMTNSRTKQCGCYEISMKLIKYETGLTQKQVDEYIKTLSDGQKIRYNADTSEFLILNWLKHNSFRSPKVLKCIVDELEEIKYAEYVHYIKSIIDYGYTIDSLSIVENTPIHTVSQEEEEQKEKKNKKNKHSDFVYLTNEEYEKLIETYGEQKILSAIDNLNNYIGSTGRKYKSHYHTILAWERKNGSNTISAQFKAVKGEKKAL